MSSEINTLGVKKNILIILFIIITLIGVFLGCKKNNKIDINNIKKSIVIILPETKITSYKNNPKGIIDNYKNSGIGAGFFINNNGLIQTVNHLVEDESLNYKILYNNTIYNSQIISRDIINDLAILKIDINNSNKLDIESIITKSEKIISFGVNINKYEIIYNTGIILNTKSKLNNISNLLQISNTLTPGFSGGPIINNKGKVVGINYAISEGNNYGIKIKK